MGRDGERSREMLLDAAEELFAQYGVDAISNRRIAEQAGAANHSAVAYHFENRDGLIRALLLRHTEAMAIRRRELLAEYGPNLSLHNIVSCRVLPLIEVLDSLPRPSWRAQFLAQIRTVPSAVKILRERASELELQADMDSMMDRVADVSSSVMRARFGVVGHLLLGVCADYEIRVNAGEELASWADVGHFLIDATAGMLSAPIGDPASQLKLSPSPDFV